MAKPDNISYGGLTTVNDYHLIPKNESVVDSVFMHDNFASTPLWSHFQSCIGVAGMPYSQSENAITEKKERKKKCSSRGRNEKIVVQKMCQTPANKRQNIVGVTKTERNRQILLCP